MDEAEETARRSVRRLEGEVLPKDMQVLYRNSGEQGLFASMISALGLSDKHLSQPDATMKLS